MQGVPGIHVLEAGKACLQLLHHPFQVRLLLRPGSVSVRIQRGELGIGRHRRQPAGVLPGGRGAGPQGSPHWRQRQQPPEKHGCQGPHRQRVYQLLRKVSQGRPQLSQPQGPLRLGSGGGRDGGGMGTALLIMTVRRSELPPVVDDQQLRRSACLFQRFQPPHHISGGDAGVEGVPGAPPEHVRGGRHGLLAQGARAARQLRRGTHCSLHQLEGVPPRRYQHRI
mmetsp:Transcript_19683/g.59499  ORF Transcript_19683/g.59499 Transcript_19683/m.59499 type:complete len:224 (+) Transcript_19683:3389-4060(+)